MNTLNTNSFKFYLIKEISNSMRELIIAAKDVKDIELLARELLFGSYVIEAYMPEVSWDKSCDSVVAYSGLPHILRSQAV